MVDSIGGANGTVLTALNGFQNITLDGDFAQFPDDTGYTNAPYVALPPGVISGKSDITLDFWFVTMKTGRGRASLTRVSAPRRRPAQRWQLQHAGLCLCATDSRPGQHRFEVELPTAGNLFLAGTSLVALKWNNM